METVSSHGLLRRLGPPFSSGELFRRCRRMCLLVFVAANLLALPNAIAGENRPVSTGGAVDKHIPPATVGIEVGRFPEKAPGLLVVFEEDHDAEAETHVVAATEATQMPSEGEIERAWKQVLPILKDTKRDWEVMKQTLADAERKWGTMSKMLAESTPENPNHLWSEAEIQSFGNRARPILADTKRDWVAMTQTMIDAKRKWEAMLKILVESTHNWDTTLQVLADVNRQAEEARRLLAASEDEQRVEVEKRLAAESNVKRLTAEAEKTRKQLAEMTRKNEVASLLLAAIEKGPQPQKDMTPKDTAAQKMPGVDGSDKQQSDSGGMPTAGKVEHETKGARPAKAEPGEKEPQPTEFAALAIVPNTADLGGGCNAPEIDTLPLPAGRMRIAVRSECRANQPVRIHYGGHDFVRELDGDGTIIFVLDAFAGTNAPVELVFADSNVHKADVVVGDEGGYSKVAIHWRAPVNLDLHAFEYTASLNGTGHVWAKSPSSFEAAQEKAAGTERGSGFMSTLAEGNDEGMQFEVYTFLHNDEQRSGVVALALDYETRGDTPRGATCGEGTDAKIDYEVTVLSRRGRVGREKGAVASVPCDTVLDHSMRYIRSALGDLRIGR